MFASYRKFAATGLLSLGLGLPAWGQTPAWQPPTPYDVAPVAAQQEVNAPEKIVRIPPPRDELTEAGLLLPGQAPTTGAANPQPLDYFYPARSERYFDEVGSQMSPEELGPKGGRPTYPYGATHYWEGQDADPEAWGDLAELPYVQLGWFATAEATLVKTRVHSRFDSSALPDPNPPITLGSATMDYTVMPELEIGYRFERGLGEFRMAFRHLDTSGTAQIAGGGYDTSGFAPLNSVLRATTVDMDFSIMEFNPEGMPFIMPLFLAPGRLGLGKSIVKSWLDVPMEYRMYFGARFVNMYYDSTATGNVFSEEVMSNFGGGGIHFGYECNQKLPIEAPVFLHLRAEGSGIWGIVDQRFQRTGAGAGIGTIANAKSGIPICDFEIGLSYAPKYPWRDFRYLVAYRYEEWFSWGQMDNSGADWSYSGIVARVEAKY